MLFQVSLNGNCIGRCLVCNVDVDTAQTKNMLIWLYIRRWIIVVTEYQQQFKCQTFQFLITLTDTCLGADCSVMTSDAGKGELTVSITSSSGENVPFELKPSLNGYEIQYTPRTSGIYTINMSYGGINVPGENTRICYKAFTSFSACSIPNSFW